MKQIIGLGLPSGILNTLSSKGTELPTFMQALYEIEKVAGQMAEAVDKSETKEEAEAALNKIEKNATHTLNKLFEEEDQQPSQNEATQEEASFNMFKEHINQFVAPGMFQDTNQQEEEEDCGCEAYADQTYFFADIIERLELGEVAVSMTIQGLLIVRTEDGGLEQENGQPIVVTPELLGSVFDIVTKPSELVAVPMHVALQAFQQGVTIVLEYKDIFNNSDDMISVEINPSLPEQDRPFVHFDALAHGMYYVKKN